MSGACIVDLDGTLCNIDHRKQLFIDGEFEKFEALMHLDPVNETLLESLARLNNDEFTGDPWKILFLTARSEKHRAVTEAWLMRHCGILIDAHFSENLFMRDVDYFSNDAQFKRHVYETLIAPHFDVKVVFEDRDQCVKMWRELGLQCWQVGPGDY